MRLPSVIVLVALVVGACGVFAAWWPDWETLTVEGIDAAREVVAEAEP